MPRNTPPTLISYTETAAFNTTGATKTLTVPSFNTGDFLTFVGICEGAVTIGVPTATGLTFTSRAANSATGSTCATRAASAPAAAGGTSVVVSATNSVSTQHWGFGVWVWRGSDGFDVAGEQHTSTKTVSMTHTDTHSGISWGIGDFAATATTGITLSPTPTHTQHALQDGAQYTAYTGDLVDQPSSGAVAYGITGGSGTGPFSIVALAVLGTTTGGGGSTVKQLPALGVG